MAISAEKVLNANDIHDVTTEKNGVLGVIGRTADGRTYRYAKNGATALAAGVAIEKSATTAATSTAAAAVVPGAVTVRTVGTVSAANAPKYEDGILTVASAQYLVNGVTNDTISLQDGVDVAIASGAATSLAANQYCGVVVKGAGTQIGTTETAVPANSYFWAFVSL